MSKVYPLLLTMLLLGGCSSEPPLAVRVPSSQYTPQQLEAAQHIPQQSESTQQQWDSNKCESMGTTKGTEGHVNCMLKLAEMRSNENAQASAFAFQQQQADQNAKMRRRQELAQGLQQLGQQLSQPPVTVNQQTHCVSRREGNQVVTDCN